MTAAAWYSFDEGRSIGQLGSENGRIVLDDEHPLGARITLESGGHHPYSITCAVSGFMVHTRFFEDQLSARTAFDAMKPELVAILALLPLASNPDPDFAAATGRVERFIEIFP